MHWKFTAAWFGVLEYWLELYPMYGDGYTYQCFNLEWDCWSCLLCWSCLWWFWWPVVFWWPCIGEGSLMCSLYLSPNELADSPMYSSLQSNMSHLYQYIIQFCTVWVPCPCTLKNLLVHLGKDKRNTSRNSHPYMATKTPLVTKNHHGELQHSKQGGAQVYKDNQKSPHTLGSTIPP